MLLCFCRCYKIRILQRVVLVAIRGHYGSIAVVYQAVEGLSLSCVRPSVYISNSCVQFVSHAVGVKTQPVEVAKVETGEISSSLRVQVPFPKDK
jgi:hypothetical protein